MKIRLVRIKNSPGIAPMYCMDFFGFRTEIVRNVILRTEIFGTAVGLPLRFVVAFLCLITLVTPTQLFAETQRVSDFGGEGLDGWEEKEFNDYTRYEIINEKESYALAARSESSASGYVKALSVDLESTPFLNWEWRIDVPLPPLNEYEKEGDDYAARLYVIRSGGLFFWKTIALNYVWSSKTSTGDIWDNAYAGENAKMLAARDSSDPNNQWIKEKRNVLKDLRKAFGEEITEIDAIAIMTDSDDSGLSAGASYRKIFFSSE